MFDVVIRGGTVVDGTGSKPARADVAITGNRVSAIRESIPEPAGRVVDATGLIVTPGFVDIHTHVDAQVFWDPSCTPLPLYGITTAIGGNCGFTLAPAAVTDRDYLTRLLAVVEEIPLASLVAGVPWDWSSTGEFLGKVEDIGPAINLGFMAGHSALRRVVMGARASAATATDVEIAQMQALLMRSLEEGALGFSSSWYGGHTDADGALAPSRHASAEELIKLSRTTGQVIGTQLAFAPDLRTSPRFSEEYLDLFTQMSAQSQRPVNWNLFSLAFSSRSQAYAQLGASDEVAARGGKLVALSYPSVMKQRREFFGHWYTDLPGWTEFADWSPSQKLDLLKRPSERRRLADAARDAREAGLDRHGLTRWDDLTLNEVISPENQELVGMRLGDLANAEGRESFEVLCDLAITDGLGTSVLLPGKAADAESWEVRLETWSDPRVVLGASDAGAHLQSLSTFDWPAELFSQNRARKALPVESLIQRMTQTPATLYGLKDRGEVVEGAYADVVVFDPDSFAPGPLKWLEDLPAGAGRVHSSAVGLHHVLVNGVGVVADGQLTAGRGGRVLRSGVDAM